MKKIYCIFLLIFILPLLFTSCVQQDPTNGKNPVPSDIVKSIISKCTFPEMISMNDNTINKFYKIPKADIESCSVYICSSGATADEIAVFKLKNINEVDEVKTLITDRVNVKTDDFKDYVPAELTKINADIIETKGKYVFFVISDNPSSAKKIFDNFFNK